MAGGGMLPSLPTLTVLVPLLSLAGLFYSASVDETFPQGCTSTNSLCFYSLLLPVTIPVYVFFHLWTWMGIKLFRHNYVADDIVFEELVIFGKPPLLSRALTKGIDFVQGGDIDQGNLRNSRSPQLGHQTRHEFIAGGVVTKLASASCSKGAHQPLLEDEETNNRIAALLTAFKWSPLRARASKTQCVIWDLIQNIPDSNTAVQNRSFPRSTQLQRVTRQQCELLQQQFEQLWLGDERGLAPHSKLSVGVLAPGEELTSFTHKTKQLSLTASLEFLHFGSGSENQCCFQGSGCK
ncbi:hypothetical protein QYF61_008724, partial [Mycteria americana]